MKLYKIFIIILSLVILSCTQNRPKSESDNLSSLPKKLTKERSRNRKKDLSNPKNTLSGKIEKKELQYIVFGCACAEWVEVKKLEEYQKSGTLSQNTIFIEPAKKELELTKSFDAFQDKIIVTGQFYDNADYPKGTPEMEEELKKALVFRYTDLKIEKLK